ncbi:hypothetical protein VA7868_02341 [Vibrio aerogenes CECT 7868]|uniref:Uncharacterized protein n=1 Tax=Vibrio aerogenes CECT 7868 TaxID=1216006 RepID=A0A1M5Z6B1_9VIBR|nr:hypothetical protein [Vibrio aerogenes]SHI19731.1 hypothetical protein VA7868_02341 [Vibrio aerogenes CECT 7868]
MELTLNAGTMFENLQLDKGQLIVPLLGPLTVSSKGLLSKGEIAVQPDVEQFLKQKLMNQPYINGAFALGGMVSFNQITAIQLSAKLFKKGKAVVLKGDIECSLTVIPAKDPNGVPDASPPTKVTIPLSPGQSKLFA